MSMASSTPRLSLAAAVVLAISFVAMPVAAVDRKGGSFQSSDGYTIRYWEAAGLGKPIVMIPGWSQTAEQFKEQKELADKYGYHVFALDMRGHGESDKPDEGYRIDRLAEDVLEFVISRNLTDVTLLGHSMGAAVAWRYWERFPDQRRRLGKLVIVEQGPLCIKDPRGQVPGGIFADKKELIEFAAEIKGRKGIEKTKGVVPYWFTENFRNIEKEWLDAIIDQNLKFPRPQAAALLREYCPHDWSKVLKTISIPTLAVFGEESLIKKDTWDWMRANIPGSRVEIFSQDEGGSHFMFMENPKKFNEVVRSFVQ
jgi:non-heme chloroperoxidase